MKLLLDEDLHPAIAEIARGLGIDVVSVHEIGRRGLSDEAQLEGAAAQERVLVTRNRDDFIQLTLLFFRHRLPHAGLLIVPYSLPNRQPERIAHALSAWCRKRGSVEPYTIEFL